MKNVKIKLPPEILNLISPLEENIQDSIVELIILELYREHKISAGKAAELLNRSKEDFINFSSRLGIPHYDYSPDDVKKDIKNIKAVL